MSPNKLCIILLGALLLSALAFSLGVTPFAFSQSSGRSQGMLQPSDVGTNSSEYNTTYNMAYNSAIEGCIRFRAKLRVYNPKPGFMEGFQAGLSSPACANL